MANRGQGRKSDIDWSNVNKTDIDGKIKAECKHCKALLSSKIERIKSHLQKCPVLIKSEKSAKESECSEMIEILETETEITASQQEEGEISKPKRKRKQSGKLYIS